MRPALWAAQRLRASSAQIRSISGSGLSRSVRIASTSRSFSTSGKEWISTRASRRFLSYQLLLCDKNADTFLLNRDFRLLPSNFTLPTSISQQPLPHGDNVNFFTLYCNILRFIMGENRPLLELEFPHCLKKALKLPLSRAGILQRIAYLNGVDHGFALFHDEIAFPFPLPVIALQPPYLERGKDRIFQEPARIFRELEGNGGDESVVHAIGLSRISDLLFQTVRKMIDAEEEIDVFEVADIFLQGMHVDVEKPGKVLHAEQGRRVAHQKMRGLFVLFRPPYGIFPDDVTRQNAVVIFLQERGLQLRVFLVYNLRKAPVQKIFAEGVTYLRLPAYDSGQREIRENTPVLHDFLKREGIDLMRNRPSRQKRCVFPLQQGRVGTGNDDLQTPHAVVELPQVLLPALHLLNFIEKEIHLAGRVHERKIFLVKIVQRGVFEGGVLEVEMKDVAGERPLFHQELDKEMQHGRLAASPDAADREDLFPAEKLFKRQEVVS